MDHDEDEGGSGLESTGGGPRPASAVTAPQATIPPTASTSLAARGAVLRDRAQYHLDEAAARLDADSQVPSEAPARERAYASFMWGLAQPALGLRTLLSHGELFVRSIGPVLGLLALCALLAWHTGAEGVRGHLAAYYAVLAGAAQVSPVLFTRSYARLAADARPRLGLDVREPYLRSFGQALVETVLQLLLLGACMAPVIALLGGVPLVGWILASVVGWAWLAHWIVVEAFDTARTLGEDESPEDFEVDADADTDDDPPWYAWPRRVHPSGFLAVLWWPVRLWAGIVARLSRRWRGEVAMVEARPWVAAGLGVGATLLLAIPIVNLFMRPAIVIAATHVLGRLEPAPTV